MFGRVHVILAVALPTILACAATQSDGNTPSPYSRVITRDELREVGVRNVYEAVQRLRPQWLLIRSGQRSFSTETEVVVFQETLLLGTPESLRRIGIDGIYQIRYLDGPTAQATLPGINDRHVQAAIVIDMSPP
ncbi:MAG: hypothetical protein IH616_05480 [Gemmatimonadales bacterium]|nr:hypothetical protein [Gemmatimonadales bacterium]